MLFIRSAVVSFDVVSQFGGSTRTSEPSVDVTAAAGVRSSHGDFGRRILNRSTLLSVVVVY